jgi:hypothetical protein
VRPYGRCRGVNAPSQWAAGPRHQVPALGLMGCLRCHVACRLLEERMQLASPGRLTLWWPCTHACSSCVRMCFTHAGRDCVLRATRLPLRPTRAAHTMRALCAHRLRSRAGGRGNWRAHLWRAHGCVRVCVRARARARAHARPSVARSRAHLWRWRVYACAAHGCVRARVCVCVCMYPPLYLPSQGQASGRTLRSGNRV